MLFSDVESNLQQLSSISLVITQELYSFILQFFNLCRLFLKTQSFRHPHKKSSSGIQIGTARHLLANTIQFRIVQESARFEFLTATSLNVFSGIL
jgi:hypothetical protein